MIGIKVNGSFVSELSEQDLLRCRAATRKATGEALTDAQCDEIIESLGPDSVVKTLKH